MSDSQGIHRALLACNPVSIAMSCRVHLLRMTVLAVDGIGGLYVKYLLLSLLVLEDYPCSDSFSSLRDDFVGMEVDLFVLEASPLSLDEDVVHPAAFT